VVSFNQGSKVLRADVLASNGVIHVVSEVLVPANFALPAKDILTVAASVSALSTLVTAIKAANVTNDFAMPNGPYTVFAPTDAAFAKLPASTLAYLLAHPDELRHVLFYHVLDHRLYAAEVKNFLVQATLIREEIVFLANSTGIFVNGESQIVGADAADCTNGVVHLIDTVLVPKQMAQRAAAWAAAPPTKNIVQLAQSVPDLSTLVTAVVAAKLADTLSGPGPFTVLAPQNEAFARLPDGVLAYLLNNIPALTAVLEYHVIAGQVSSSQITDREVVPSLQGGNLTFRVIKDRRGARIFVDDAEVIAADNYATNGVVHIIDQVLFPPTTEVASRRALRG